MADMSRVNEKIQTLGNKVDELISKANSGGGDGVGMVTDQAEVDQIESRLDEILARIP